MRDVLVLCYHGVSDTWPSQLAVAPETLEEQVARLLARGYRPATFREAVLDPPAPRTLAVTFDDACRSVHELALPVLRSLGVPGCVYAPTSWIGRTEPMRWAGIEEWHGGPHERELLPMSWEQLGEVAEEGWEVGSHTCTHPHLTQLDDATLAEELRASRELCAARLGRACDTIAYPYGDVDGRVVAATAAAGYAAAGSIASKRPPAPLDWPRVGIWRADARWRAELKTAPLVRRLRAREQLPGRRSP
ncbi:MAG: polysaccharide deacetylase family protein [Actinobacteria bacterium]|nr:polysaccharide deacetylase family protein [Actinomycetota bacterium]